MDALIRTCPRSIQTTSHRPHGRSVGGSPTDFCLPLGSPLESWETGRLGTTVPDNRGAKLLALTLRDPEDADFVSPGVHEPFRSAFTETLTNTVIVFWILTAKPDMNHLFNNAVDDTLCDRLPPRLQIV